MADLELDEIDITGVDEHPVDTSVKLHGPPGTGKTTQSAARVGTLLRDYGYELDDVAWATYRKSLAMDTLQRLADWGVIDERELNEPHQGATRMIGTTHAIANRCSGDLPDPVEPWHKKDFCDRLGVQYWSAEPWEETIGQQLFRVFEWLKTNRLNPAEPAHIRRCQFAEDLLQDWNGDIPQTWGKWQDYKGQRNIIDFYEMLEAPLRDETPPTGGVLVIDEYHDATPLMAELCEMWIDYAEVVIVAGDPNQVVNAFDGANPKFFEELDLPKVLLDKTYRVGEEHWQAATSMLQKAHTAPPVERMGTGKISEYRSPQFGYSRDTGWDVPGPENPGSPGEIEDKYDGTKLYLTRTRMQADGVGRALERAGVPYYSQDKLHGWNHSKAQPVPALYNALQKIRSFEAADFTGSGLSRYQSSTGDPGSVKLDHEEAASLLEHTNAKYLAETRSDTKDRCSELRQNEADLTLTEFDNLVDDRFWARHTSGAASVDRLNKGDLSDRNREALKKALMANTDPINREQLNDLDVGVMTIHASKGAEAEHVIVYDGVSKRIRQSMSNNEREYQNEWRTWYVALTRASDHLHIMRNGWQWAHEIIPEDILEIVDGAQQGGA